MADAHAAPLRCTRPAGTANFGDALITACSRGAGIEEKYSCDQRFARAGLTPA